MKAGEFQTVPCRGCGKKIVWARKDGKPIPLDPVPPVYIVEDLSMLGDAGPDYRATRSMAAMVSHFATCPKANDFSGGNRASTAKAE